MERKNVLMWSLLGIMAFFLFFGTFMYKNQETIFHQTTPYLLAVFAVVAIAYAPRWQYALIALLTFAIEVIGVFTGFPFGPYYYTSRLGFSVLSVPVLVGINWVWITIGAKQFAYVLNISNKWLQAALTGLAVVLFDILLEPIAIALEWWVWPEGVGLANYISWFVIGALASFWIKKEHKIIFPAMFLMQLLFFITMLLVI